MCVLRAAQVWDARENTPRADFQPLFYCGSRKLWWRKTLIFRHFSQLLCVNAWSALITPKWSTEVSSHDFNIRTVSFAI